MDKTNQEVQLPDHHKLPSKSNIYSIFHSKRFILIFVVILVIIVGGGVMVAYLRMNRQSQYNTPQNAGQPQQDKFAQIMQDLGCNSQESCKAACEKPENRDKCQSMMQGMNRSGTPIFSDTRNWNATSQGTGGGILYAENLPSCQGTEQFSSPPAVLGTYDNISPLGQTSANHGNSGHVFPVDHMYFNFKHTSPGNYSSSTLPATILSPGDIEVFQINSITYETDGKDSGSDYHLYFAPCREVTAYLGHLGTLSPKLQTAIDHADQKSCGSPFNTGSPPNTILKPCSYSLLLKLKSGEEIGTAGGSSVAYLSSFDFGVYDQRIQPLPFVDQKYWTPLNLHAVCGLHYYPDGPVKTSLLAKINNTKKDANGNPDCGTNMWDKAGTIQGNWVLPNTPVGRVPDMQGLAIVHSNVDPSQGLIDWGSGIAPADRIRFSIGNNGFINRDPADVKADGSVYCFQDTIAGRGIKLQLVNDSTLKAEYTKDVCSSSPTLYNPTIYVR